MMTFDRIRTAASRQLMIALSVVVAVAIMTGCVSVQKSGNQEPSPPPPPTTGVEFRSSPESAEVFIDGEFRGSTPVRLHLAAGTHKIELRLPGFETWERELVVVAGDDTRVAARLERE
jgi:hypothetical protein